MLLEPTSTALRQDQAVVSRRPNKHDPVASRKSNDHHKLAEGVLSAPFLPVSDPDRQGGFAPFRKFSRKAIASPSSISRCERTDPTTIQCEIGGKHSHPPKLGARFDPSDEASVDQSPVTLRMDIRVGSATFRVPAESPSSSTPEVWFESAGNHSGFAAKRRLIQALSGRILRQANAAFQRA